MLDQIQHFIEKRQSKIISVAGKFENNNVVKSMKTAFVQLNIVLLTSSFLAMLLYFFKGSEFTQQMHPLLFTLAGGYGIFFLLVFTLQYGKASKDYDVSVFAIIYFILLKIMTLTKIENQYDLFLALMAFALGLALVKTTNLLIEKLKTIIKLPMAGTLDNLIKMIYVPMFLYLSFILIKPVMPYITKYLFAYLNIDNPVMVFVVVFVEMFLWYLGMNGYGVIVPIVLFFAINNLNMNFLLMSEGRAPQYIFTPVFWDYFLSMTGSGIIGGIVILSLFSKNKNVKSLGKSSLTGALFAVSEPMVFGVPLVMNKIFFFPFVVGPAILGVLQWFVFHWGWVKMPTFFVADMPLPFSVLLTTLDWRSLLMAAMVLLLSVAMYYPAFRYYENHTVVDEKEDKFDDLDLDF